LPQLPADEVRFTRVSKIGITPFQLCQASIENLERLAKFMGIQIPPQSPDYKQKLVLAILQADVTEHGLHDEDEN
jgi:hypothetical protein